ncbi:MAG: PLP-dependent aminotransferase family protein [Rhodospirillaceae bacterium]|nr:PLP-dependent aminotransferase family protein [Rhodospirillaceae bacterium]
MNIWTPNISERPGPKYKAIADSILIDIRSGGLAPGERMPTHRELAYRLGVTVGTVTRAYSEAERRGLVAGEVGRGTYVRNPNEPREPKNFSIDKNFSLSVQGSDTLLAEGVCDFSLSLPISGISEKYFAKALTDIGNSQGLGSLLDYTPDTGLPSHRQAGAAWIKQTSGMKVTPSQIIITNGAQHAVLAAVMSLTVSGDTILTECITYHGIKTLASEMGLKLIGLEMDEQGITTASFETACKEHSPKALYTIPTLQNPTSRTMGEKRRKEIAKIAINYNVAIIEDDIFGAIPEQRPLPISSYAPSQSYYLTSFSKCIAPGLRYGFIAVPENLAPRIGSIIRDTCRMATPLMGEIVTQWIESGVAAEITSLQRSELATRQAIATRELKGLDYEMHPNSFNILLYPPEPWREEEFALAAKEKGVLVMPASVFAVGQDSPRHAVRICLGATRNFEHVEKGLKELASLIRGGNNAYASSVV